MRQQKGMCFKEFQQRRFALGTHPDLQFEGLPQRTYHGLGKKHLQSYFDEFCFRFNRRFWPHQLFPRLVCAVAASYILGYGDLMR